MISAWVPVWIIGAPVAGILLLSAMFSGPASASASLRDERRRGGELDTISRLSGPVSPGAISHLSGRVSPGAISRLSGPVSPGAIARLSGRKSPGAISRLSGHTSPGAISRLSSPRPVGSIARLSSGFYVSNLLGLPLLTRSQAPLEPDKSLLTSDRQ